MPREKTSRPGAEHERTNHVGTAALVVIGLTLLSAAALGTYQASLAKAHAVHDAVPERQADPMQYLPGSTGQIGTLREPLMVARRNALRAGFDRDEAPIDAFDRLRTVPGHEDEARSLLAQFWERKGVLADDPVRRVLYALQARVVDDDEGRRRTAASAMTALGPLRRVRHVAEGTIVSADARTVVVQGSGWLRVANLETGASFDLPDGDAVAALVDGRRMVTWGDGTARLWDLGSDLERDAGRDPGRDRDAAPTAPTASFKLMSGEAPLSFAGGCVLTSDGRVWSTDGGTASVIPARGRSTAGSIDATCDHVVLRGDKLASYRRRGDGWVADSSRPWTRGPNGKPLDMHVEACAARAPRCVLRDPSGLRSVWDFGASPARRLTEGVDCETRRFSPDGTRLMCRESQDGVTFYSEDQEGNWARADAVLPALGGVVLQDDGTVCGSVPWKDGSSGDRADVMFLAAHECWAPPAAERAWGSIRMQPSGNGAVFTYPPTARGASGYTEFFGFGSKGESLATASDAWFGERARERLLERDATDSAGERGYELDGEPFDPSQALGQAAHASSVQIDKAFFVESPEPSLIFEIGYLGGEDSSASEARQPQRAVARWDLRGKRFCGDAVPGAIDGLAPGGDTVVIDGRIETIGACTSDRPFEPTDVTGAVAVGPDAARWITRDGDTLQLQGPQRDPVAVPSVGLRGDKGGALQVAFNPAGDRFFVRTAASLCAWVIREDGTLDLDGCRWSTGGWVSNAAWAAGDKSGETVLVFERTAEGAAVRGFFGSRESDPPGESNGQGRGQDNGELACNSVPKAEESPLSVLQRWEERLGHRFKDQATQLSDAREMISSEIVPVDAPVR